MPIEDYCAVCRTDSEPLAECPECGFAFCSEHADPETHRCPAVEGTNADGVLGGLDPTTRIRAALAATAGPLRGLREFGATVGRTASESARDALASVRSAVGEVRRTVGGLRGATAGGPVRKTVGRLGRTTVGRLRRFATSAAGTATGIGAVPRRAGREVRRRSRKIPATVGRRLRTVARVATRTRPPMPTGGRVANRRVLGAVLAVSLLLGVAVTVGTVGGVDDTIGWLGSESGDAGRDDAGANGDSVQRDALEDAILGAVNDVRAGANVTPFVRESALTQIAGYHSRDMASQGYTDVVSPDGETIEDRFERFDVRCEPAGQTVMWVDGAQGTPVSEVAGGIVDRWQSSREHASFLRNETYRAAGVGVAVGTSGRVYVSLTVCRTGGQSS